MPKFKDLTGQRFGRLVVLNKGESHRQPNGKTVIKWNCICNCGKKTLVSAGSLIRGATKSCGCFIIESAKNRIRDLHPSFINLTGKKFNKWTVLKLVDEERNGNTYWFCRCECGTERKVTVTSLHQGKSKSCGKCIEREDLTDKIFGKLKVLDLSHIDSKKRIQIWNCFCECGNKTKVAHSSLKCGHTKSCGCSNFERQKNKACWKGFGEISKTYFSNIKNGAFKRNLIFQISIQDMWEVYNKQNRICVLTGLPLSFSSGRQKEYDGRFDGNASLDRINSNIGYINNNIQWINKNINLMKSDMSLENYIYYSKLVINPISSQQLNVLQENIMDKKKHFNWKGFGNIGSEFFSLIRGSAEKRKLIFKITIEEVWNLFLKQNRKCALTGLELVFGNYKKGEERTASLDRIDSSIGYEINNLQWVHKNINRMKLWHSNNQFIEYCRLVDNHNP
jgi:hypothetical protein